MKARQNNEITDSEILKSQDFIKENGNYNKIMKNQKYLFLLVVVAFAVLGINAVLSVIIPIEILSILVSTGVGLILQYFYMQHFEHYFLTFFNTKNPLNGYILYALPIALINWLSCGFGASYISELFSEKPIIVNEAHARQDLNNKYDSLERVKTLDFNKSFDKEKKSISLRYESQIKALQKTVKSLEIKRHNHWKSDYKKDIDNQIQKLNENIVKLQEEQNTELGTLNKRRTRFEQSLNELKSEKNKEFDLLQEANQDAKNTYTHSVGSKHLVYLIVIFFSEFFSIIAFRYNSLYKFHLIRVQSEGGYEATQQGKEISIEEQSKIFALHSANPHLSVRKFNELCRENGLNFSQNTTEKYRKI